jgi:hypothetical protein
MGTKRLMKSAVTVLLVVIIFHALMGCTPAQRLIVGGIIVTSIAISQKEKKAGDPTPVEVGNPPCVTSPELCK